MDKLIIKEVTKLRDKDKGAFTMRFFRTGKGEYGEGDIFYGLTVPASRKIASKYIEIDLKDLEKVIQNKVHEIRLIALIILNTKYKKAKTEKECEALVKFYLKNIPYINNWDLVDVSAYNILGAYLKDKNLARNASAGGDRSILIKLSQSRKLWSERIAIVSTFAFIKNNDLDLIFYFGEYFLNHKHDLIHKALGWMLREAGKRDEKRLKEFLEKNKTKMPRTMLRYAIEKFSDKERKYFLGK
ncbi:MAG: DNA alkylation repair protein [Candidatus Pacebacteria bacterium]|nr:DNA alkylation repair protein [Candidatus Paceibacterota bacterium]